MLLNHGVLARTLVEAGVSVDLIPECRHGFTDLARSISAITRRFGADVVHTHRYKENILGAWAAARVGRLPVAAVIVGSGSMREAAEAESRSPGSGLRVALVDPVPHGERLVASLDVLVVPSDSE